MERETLSWLGLYHVCISIWTCYGHPIEEDGASWSWRCDMMFLVSALLFDLDWDLWKYLIYFKVLHLLKLQDLTTLWLYSKTFTSQDLSLLNAWKASSWEVYIFLKIWSSGPGKRNKSSFQCFSLVPECIKFIPNFLLTSLIFTRQPWASLIFIH